MTGARRQAPLGDISRIARATAARRAGVVSRTRRPLWYIENIYRRFVAAAVCSIAERQNNSSTMNKLDGSKWRTL